MCSVLAHAHDVLAVALVFVLRTQDTLCCQTVLLLNKCRLGLLSCTSCTQEHIYCRDRPDTPHLSRIGCQCTDINTLSQLVLMGSLCARLLGKLRILCKLWFTENSKKNRWGEAAFRGPVQELSVVPQNCLLSLQTTVYLLFNEEPRRRQPPPKATRI